MKGKSGKKSQPTPIRRVPIHELFPQPGMQQPLRTTHVVARTPRRRPLMWGLVFLSLLLGGFGIFGYMNRGNVQTPFVLLDLRAIEPSGHPVTAARVVVNGKQMGVTDSFGEWRRYLKIAANEAIRVELSKDSPEVLLGVKDLAVPRGRNSGHDIEIKTSIEMTGRAQKPVAQNSGLRSKPAAKVPEPVFEEKVKEKESTPPLESIARVDEDADQSEFGDSNDKSLGIFFDDGLSRIAIQTQPYKNASADLLEKRQANIVRERVMPILANELQSLGLRVDKAAPWKLMLNYVPFKDQAGYIRAEVIWQNPFGQQERSSFIAGFSKTYEETGRAMAALLRLHMKKTHWAFKENGEWFIDESDQTKDFWRLKPGSLLTDTGGEKFPIVKAAQLQSGTRWKLKIGSTQPCEAVRQRSRCMVSTESLRESPPLVGWTRKKLQIQGNALPAQSEVYIAGFQAQPLGDNQYQYWAHSGSSMKVLVLAGNRIVHNENIKDVNGIAALRVLPGPGPKQARR